MAKTDQPRQGGSYIRNKDGSLKRVGGTEEARPAAPAKVPADAPLPAAPDDSNKGK